MEEHMREWKYNIKWKQNAKGDWYCEQISVKGDTPDELEVAQAEAIRVMKNGKEQL